MDRETDPFIEIRKERSYDFGAAADEGALGLDLELTAISPPVTHPKSHPAEPVNHTRLLGFHGKVTPPGGGEVVQLGAVS